MKVKIFFILLISTSITKASELKIPYPIKMFEMYCFETNANYKATENLVNFKKLKRLPPSLESIVAPQTGGGKGYMVSGNKEKKQYIMLGTSPLNSCSIYSQGFDTKIIITSMKNNYKLKLLNSDNIGLSVNELYVPGGVKGTVGEAGRNGVIGITYAKDNDSITVSFISPETATKLFAN